jgi:hypothetical protein
MPVKFLPAAITGRTFTDKHRGRTATLRARLAHVLSGPEKVVVKHFPDVAFRFQNIAGTHSIRPTNVLSVPTFHLFEES